MIAVADADILSMFGKAGALKLLKKAFPDISLPPEVYKELLRARDLGYDFVDTIIEEVEVLNLTEEEFREFETALKNEKYLQSGELQAIVICRNRGGVLLSNDRKAGSYCSSKGIIHFDVKGILRAIYLKNIANKDDIKEIIRAIEEKDNTKIKNPGEIFR
jgi:predicted nucleic acid-binding protein